MNARRCMWAPGEDALHYLSLALCDRRRVRNATTFPPQKLIGPDVADGSFATKLDRPRHVRFPPVSDRTADIAGGPFRVESRCGPVALGRTYLLPPLSFRGASMIPPWLRFHIPLIEPDRQISRIRLSDKTSRLRAQRHLQLLNIYRS